MERSPFPYQGPLSPTQVHGRDDLVLDLTQRVEGRRVTAVLGPRRYGKTSLLGRVAAGMSNVTTVWVDLYEVTSMSDVAVRFDDALGTTSGPFAALLRRIAATVAVNLGVVRVELTGPAPARPDPALVLRGLLTALVGAAANEPTLLVVDEFSSIDQVRGAAGALRTALQHHYGELGILFAGSQPSMMRTLFTDRPQPFFGQADLVEVGPLDRGAVEDIVRTGFTATGRDPGHVAGAVAELGRGHPQRTMQLADACWRHTPPGATADAAVWGASLEEVRASVADGLERLYSGYQAGQRTVLRAVACSGSIYGNEAEALDLSKGSATHSRRTLMDQGDLVMEDGHLRVVDPLLSDWIRHRFPM